jgi:hypothetical protein
MMGRAQGPDGEDCNKPGAVRDVVGIDDGVVSEW